MFLFLLYIWRYYFSASETYCCFSSPIITYSLCLSRRKRFCTIFVRWTWGHVIINKERTRYLAVGAVNLALSSRFFRFDICLIVTVSLCDPADRDFGRNNMAVQNGDRPNLIVTGVHLLPKQHFHCFGPPKIRLTCHLSSPFCPGTVPFVAICKGISANLSCPCATKPVPDKTSNWTRPITATVKMFIAAFSSWAALECLSLRGPLFFAVDWKSPPVIERRPRPFMFKLGRCSCY